jgi:hypothetical protein
MKKEEINEIVNTVIKNHTNTFPGEKSVSRKKIRGLVENLIERGIQVSAVSAPYSKQILEDPHPRVVDCQIVAYKVGPEYSIEIDDDTSAVFLYKWTKHKEMGKDSILRLKAITRKNG